MHSAQEVLGIFSSLFLSAEDRLWHSKCHFQLCPALVTAVGMLAYCFQHAGLQFSSWLPAVSEVELLLCYLWHASPQMGKFQWNSCQGGAWSCVPFMGMGLPDLAALQHASTLHPSHLQMWACAFHQLLQKPAKALSNLVHRTIWQHLIHSEHKLCFS